MFFLIYVSTAVELMSDEDLHALLEQSQEKNKRLDITGMLIYKGGTFMQYLEGPKKEVLELYETIKIDARHRGVFTIMEKDIDKRNFSQWSMGFHNMEKFDVAEGYEAYIKDNLYDLTFSAPTMDAYNFMISFNRALR